MTHLLGQHGRVHGQKFNIRAWHNATTAKTLYLGGACFINIELFESI